MFKNLKLGARIGLGFAALVALTCFLGGSNAWQMNTAIGQATRLSNEYVPESEYASKFDVALMDVQLAVRSYGLTYDQKYLTEANAAVAKCKEAHDALQKLSSEYPALVKLAEALPQIGKNFGEFEGYIAQTEDLVKALSQTQEQLNTAAGTWAKNIDEFQQSQEEKLREDIETNVGVDKLSERAKKIELVAQFRNLGNQVRIAAWKSQAERDPSIIQGVIGKFDEMNKAVEELRPLVHTQQNIDELNACATAANDYKKAVDGLLDQWTKLQAVGTKRAESATATGELVAALSSAAIEQSTERAQASRDGLTTAMYILIAGLGVAIVIGATLGWFITRGITKPVNRIIQSLTDGANQVNDASRQVSSASQQLAAGASEQASSLEETSSALEEMAAMTRTNASNSEKANGLATQARKNADDGEKTMGDLNNAMTAINDSAAQIGKIIKVIEEIAFQTNLLALNAAVEAARAGEHGKGFAVVAEEVRNLAQRSAQAARDTTNLIEGAVNRAKEGTSVASNAAKSLNAIVSDVANVAELLAGISRASNEQAQGVDQINSAVSQMDKVTQQNAAGAEESASAAEQLSAQAQTVKAVVDELTALVRGGNACASSSADYSPKPNKFESSGPKFKPATPKGGKSASKPGHGPNKSEDDQFAALAESAQSYDAKCGDANGDLSGF